MSATPRRSARLAAKAPQPATPVRMTKQEVPSTPKKVNHVFGSASPADFKKDVSASKKVARDISYLFSPAVPANLSIPTPPVQQSRPRKNAVYRSIADKLFDETQPYREKLMRENIHNLITHQLDAASRNMPKCWDCDEQTLFQYSFIVAPLLDSLAQSYANWDNIPLCDVYNVMYYWRPDARTVSISCWMSDKFLHDWNVCRDRILNYGLVFPYSNQ